MRDETSKLHGILFKPEMILALLNTQSDVWPAQAIDPDKPFKWQTRRAIKHPEYYGCPTGDCPHERQADCDKAMASNDGPMPDCPHPVGTVLYAKETHWRWGRYRNNGTFQIIQPGVSELSSIRFAEWIGDEAPHSPRTETGWHKRPPILQPKAIARLWFEVMRVRVERVNQISEADCEAEGIKWSEGAGAIAGDRCYHMTTSSAYSRIAAHAYEDLFDSINGKGSFKRGDWCWVYDLKRITKP